MGFLLIIPITRKILIKNISSKYKNKNNVSKNIVEGDYEETKQDNDKIIKWVTQLYQNL